MLVVLFLAWRSARKATVHRYPVLLPAPIELGPGATALDDRELELVGAGVGAGGEALAAGGAAALPEASAKAIAPAPPKELLSEHLVELIDSQPDDVAQMLRGWLADRRG